MRHKSKTSAIQAEKWKTKTIRLPPSVIRELEKVAGERKPDRQYPWKVQDIVCEALREHLMKLRGETEKAESAS